MPLWGRSGSYADGDRPARPEPGTPVSWRDVYRPVDHPATIDRPPGDARATPENATGPAAPPLNRQRAVQMHNLYLVVETEDGILIIDQHALHERVMYEKLKEMLARGPLEAQRLLLPETVNTTASQVALLGEYEDLLKRLGVEVRQIGPDAVAIHTFPALIRNARPAEFVRDLADQLESKPKAGTEDFVHDVLDMMACKAAVKAGDPLTPAEVDALIAQRHLVEKSSNCPHGRPTTLRLTKEHLNRQFKRT